MTETLGKFYVPQSTTVHIFHEVMLCKTGDGLLMDPCTWLDFWDQTGIDIGEFKILKDVPRKRKHFIKWCQIEVA